MTGQNGGSPEPAPGGAEETASTLLVATATSPDSPIVPVLPSRHRSYRNRFLIIYGVLVLVLGGAIAGIVVANVKSGGGHVASGWSTWTPANGTTANVTKQIADHVAKEYKLNKAGQQLVGIVPEAPVVASGTHKISISNIALRTSPNGKGIEIVPSARIWTDQLCGFGTGNQCSISGQPTETRGRLVRREALEVALYTFKYVPSIDTVLAFMPPPAGQQQSTLLFLQRDNLTKELAQPLRSTLPLETPPLPNDPNLKEKATIDRLTLPTVYSYKLQQLQDTSALLVLNPFQS